MVASRVQDHVASFRRRKAVAAPPRDDPLRQGRVIGLRDQKEVVTDAPYYHLSLF
jgi:hypothetical protein